MLCFNNYIPEKKCVDSPNINNNNNKNIVSAPNCTNVEVDGKCIVKCKENYAILKTKTITQTINCKAGGIWETPMKKCKGKIEFQRTYIVYITDIFLVR